MLYAISPSSNNSRRNQREYNTCEIKVRPVTYELPIQYETEAFGS